MYSSHNGFSPQNVYHSSGGLDRHNGPPVRAFPQMVHSQYNGGNEYHRANLPSMNHPAATSIYPRSASEALFDTTNKIRQLPCRTFISVGTCPYRERCVYLHDPRCLCKEAKTKTRRKNKEDVVLDSIFWPVMPYHMVAGKLDMNRQPHVIQPYLVPMPQRDQYHRHDAAVYSLWMHFVDFCTANTESANARHPDNAPCFCAPDVTINGYTEEPRLHVFRVLAACNGRPVNKDEFLRVTSAVIPPFAKRVTIPVLTQQRLSPMRPEVPYEPVQQGPTYTSSAAAALASRYDTTPRRSAYNQEVVQPDSLAQPAAHHSATAAVGAQILSTSPPPHSDEMRVSSPHSGIRTASSQLPSAPSRTFTAALTSLSVLMSSVPHRVTEDDPRRRLNLQQVSPSDPWQGERLETYTDAEREFGYSSSSYQQESHSARWSDGSIAPSSRGDSAVQLGSTVKASFGSQAHSHVTRQGREQIVEASRVFY